MLLNKSRTGNILRFSVELFVRLPIFSQEFIIGIGLVFNSIPFGVTKN